MVRVRVWGLSEPGTDRAGALMNVWLVFFYSLSLLSAAFAIFAFAMALRARARMLHVSRELLKRLGGDDREPSTDRAG